MIKININKAKEISHDMRRAARSEEFKQLDIEATIPSMAEQAEIKRESVREKYAEIQVSIDAAETVDNLKEIIQSI